MGDLPAALNHILFGGGDATLIAAQALLAMLIMISVGVVLAMAKAPPMGFFVVEGGVLVCLCIIGWLNAWVLLFIALLILFVLSTKIAKILTGNTGGE